MEFLSNFVDKVADCLMQPVTRGIGYLYYYESNIRSLENESKKLEEIRIGVQQRAEAARRNIEVISSTVKDWLTSVDTTTDDVADILRGRAEVERGCFYGWCPNLKSRYSLSRRAKKITLEAIELQTEGKDYVDFSYPVPAVDYIKLEEVEAMAALRDEGVTTLCSHQLPTAYFSKLEKLKVLYCGNLINLMSPSVARGVLNLRKLEIRNCPSMEEVITEEEQQGEEMTNETLFPLLEELHLENLQKLGHFFHTKRALEFPFLREIEIHECSEMKTFVQLGSVSTPSLESVNNDEVEEVVDLNKSMFNSKVSCPSLKRLFINGANSITSLCSHQLPTAYFRKLEILEVHSCGKLRNLMSPSVARGVLNLQKLKIENCSLMEEVITEEEQQGEEIMTNEPLFPLLEKLILDKLPKLGHFFLTKSALEFPFLREVNIDHCPEMKTFVQQGSVSTPSLKSVNNDDEVKVVDLNKAMFNKKLDEFQNVKDLRLAYCDSLPHALNIHYLNNIPFPKLERLEVSSCGGLQYVFYVSLDGGSSTVAFPDDDELEEISRRTHIGPEVIKFPNLYHLDLKFLECFTHFCSDTVEGIEFPLLQFMIFWNLIEFQNFWPTANNSTTDLNPLFHEKVSCPSLEKLELLMVPNITALCSHQLPTAYFSKLEILKVLYCGKLRNLLSPSVARGVLNLRILSIGYCESMEEVITEEEQQGEEIMTNEPLFPLLEKLELRRLPKLRHFFLTKRALEFPLLREVMIHECPEMNTFFLRGSVSTPSLESVNNGYRLKVDDLNKWIQQRFNSKEEDGSESEASIK